MSDLPKELPEVPTGWTKHLNMHLNFGHGKNGGGMGLYAIHDPEGNETPIKYQYDTRKGGETGFFVDEIQHCVSWKELRELWPTVLAKRQEK